jgi:hypothetical protein
LIAKKHVARLPLSAGVEQSTHGPWQMAAMIFPCSAMRRTSFRIASSRRRKSGANPPGITTMSKSSGVTSRAERSLFAG